MAGAAELVSNQGNANLSVGSNNAIPVIADNEKSGYNGMQEVANKMMLQNHAFNWGMFQQKLRDRDELYNQLDKGQVTVGDIDPKDRPYYEQAKKEQEKAFYDMAQNGGVANKEAYRKYIQSTTALKEVATHVQARKIGIDAYKNQIAKEPIAAKKKQIEEQFTKQYDKDSATMIDPYQTSLDFDADKLLATGLNGAIAGTGVPQTVTTQSVRTKETPGKPTVTTKFEKTSPITGKGKQAQSITTVTGTPQQGVEAAQTSNIVYKNGLPYSVSRQYVDFNKIKQNYNDSFLEKNGEGTELQSQFYDKFTDPNILSHDEIKPTYDLMVKKAEEYNRARGFTPLPDGSMSAQDLANGAADVKKLINAFNVPPDPQTGKRNINMSKPELASYFALAHNNNFATQSETLLKDEADLSLKDKQISGQLKIQAQNAASLGRLRNAQIKKINKSLEGKSHEEQKAEFDKYWYGNGASIINQEAGLNQSKLNPLMPTGSIPYEKSRPVYTTGLDGQPKILKPIGGIPVYENYKYSKDGELTGASRIIGYQGGHYESQFYNKATGGTIGVDSIQEGFKKAKKSNPDLTEQDYLINLGNAGITFRMIGDNGTSANVDDNGNNLRILNNKFTTKGEQQPIENDTQVFDQPNEE